MKKFCAPLLFPFLILLLMIKCEGYDLEEIIIKNNSDHSIYYSMTIEDEMFDIEKYRTNEKRRAIYCN